VGRKSSQASSRLILGQFYADILLANNFPDPCYHWVVQRVGSAAVLAWGQESSLEMAEKAAYQFLHEQMVAAASAG